MKAIVNREPQMGGFIVWVGGFGQVAFFKKEKEANACAKVINEIIESITCITN